MTTEAQTTATNEPDSAAALAAELLKARRENLKPPPRLNLVEWADAHRYLSAEASAEPGRWKTTRVEVARGPMLAVTEPGIHEITIVSSTQLMKTELLLNIVGYFVHQDPAPMMLIQPTVNLSKAFSKDRVDTMIRDTPVLRSRVKDKKSRDSGNTMQHKVFPGGHLTLAGANAPGELASRPVRVVLCDETDKYPASAGEEGDPIKLVSERSATFWNYLIVKTCSPTVDGASRIMKEYEDSDMRIYEIPCPHCDHVHEPQWENVHWDEGKPETAGYVCPACGTKWTEAERLDVIQHGTWRATRPTKGHAGFKANKLVSPWEPLSKLADKWERAQGNPQLLKTFYNTQLAKTYKDQGERPDHERLHDAAGAHNENEIPAEVAFLTAGVDVQKDRLELEIVGWAPGKRSFSIDYRTIMGETSKRETWAELAALLGEEWDHPSGSKMRLRLMAIDSGYRTPEVYDFCRTFGISRVVPVKGMESQQAVISAPRAVEYRRDGKVITGVKMYTVGVSSLKDELYGWLRLRRNEDGTTPPGWCQFPKYAQGYFKELTSEYKITTTNKRNMQITQWVRTPGVRNEPLDCRNYARAAAAVLGMDRWKAEQWAHVYQTAGVHAAAVTVAEADPLVAAAEAVAKQAPPKPQAKPKRERRRGPSIWGTRR